MDMRLAFGCDCRPAKERIVTSMEMVVKAAKQSDDGYYDMRFLEVSSSKRLLHPKLMNPNRPLSDIELSAYIYSAIYLCQTAVDIGLLQMQTTALV